MASFTWNWQLGTVLVQATAASWALCRRSRRFTSSSKRKVCFCQMQRKRGCPSLYASSTCCTTNRLSREALAEVTVVKEWKMPPKMHLFIHLMEWQVTEIGLNPRGYWTNADADLFGTMVEVNKSCHPSTPAPVSLTKVAALGTARRVSGDLTIVANYKKNTD